MDTKTINGVTIIATHSDQEINNGDVPMGTVAVIYDYTRGDYDGSGIALAVTKDGAVWEKSLSHCSCYGAFGADSHGWAAHEGVRDIVAFCERDENGVDRLSGYEGDVWSRLRQGAIELAAIAQGTDSP